MSWISFNDVFWQLELMLTDSLYIEKEAPSNKIVVVGIDDESTQDIGSWPWPRKVHGKTIEKISEGNPIAIGVDILF